MGLILNVLAFFCFSTVLSFAWNEKPVNVFPISAAMLIVMLYVMAFFHVLWATNILSAIILVSAAVFFVIKYGRQNLGKLAERLFSPQMISVAVMMALTWALLRNVEMVSRDDYGCWAAEAKSIFYYSGFAPKYQNAAASFGTYFPGVTLFRVWLCFASGGYKAGLLAVGSAWLVIILLAPLLDTLDYSRLLSVPIGITGSIFLLFLPGVFDMMTYQSVCAEPIMSAAFIGMWFVLLSDNKKLSRHQLLAYSFCLCFFKASGIAFMASIFLFAVICRKSRKTGTSLLDDLQIKELAAGALISVIPALIWLVFCRVMARQDYFTVAISPEGQSNICFLGYLRSLLVGVFAYPAHYAYDGILDLPLAAIVVLCIALWFLAYKLCLLKEPRLKQLLVYYLAMLAVMLTALVLMHSFVFREELYLDPGAMMISVARYCQPVIIAPMVLLVPFTASAGCKKKRTLLLCLLMSVVMTCTSLWTVYYRVIDTRQSIRQAENMYAYVEDISDPFLTVIKEEKPGRVVYVYSEALDLQDTAKTCLQYMASPNSVISCEISDDPDAWQEESRKIRMLSDASKAEYIYFDMSVPSDFLQDYVSDFPTAKGKLHTVH